MNIIFLDVDYVLNSISNAIEEYEKTKIPRSGKDFPFDESCMFNLKYIVEKTNAVLVITSSWRKYEDHKQRLLEELNKYGLVDHVIGYTKDLGNRVLEIKDYLNSLDCEVNFIILDDYAYMEDLVEHLISTNAYYGLTEVEAASAVKKLNRVQI